jgi:hypothetical protein
MDDWFFTQGLQLTAGTTYEVSFSYRSGNSSFPEKIAVDWGNTAAASSMSGSPIFNNNNFTNTDWTIGTGIFIPTATGTYYVGFHGYSDADMASLFIDDIKILEVVPATTWQGTVNTDWLNPNNWSEGLPSSTTRITIPTGLTNYPIIDNNTVCGTIVIE